MKDIKKAVLCASLSVVIAGFISGCGGGGGGDYGGSSGGSVYTPPPAPPTSEGVYVGTASNGLFIETLVLENGQTYALYGTQTNSAYFVTGVIEGVGATSGTNFSIANLKDFSSNGAVVSGSFVATVNPGVSLTGTLIEAGGQVTFPGLAPLGSSYVYASAPNLSLITGSWSGNLLIAGEPVNFTIGTNGSVTGLSAGNCSFAGTIAPRASGKNVFDFNITFGAPPCALPNQAASGSAISYLLSNGQRQIIMAGADSTGAHGSVVFAVR